jgi:dihydrofolate reductase
MTKKSTLLFLFLLSLLTNSVIAQDKPLTLQYVLSIPKPESNYCHVDVQVKAWRGDTVYFKMPKWMPGYYQLMNYAKAVENISAKDENGKSINLKRVNENTWTIAGAKRKSFTLSYDVKAKKKFVANSIVDATHAYLVTTTLNPDSYRDAGLTKTTIISDNLPDRINEIKQSGPAPGGSGSKDILLFGSPTATHSLIQLNLIDGYWLFVNPIILGRGIPLFVDIKDKIKLKLLTTRQFPCGVTELNYTVESSLQQIAGGH